MIREGCGREPLAAQALPHISEKVAGMLGFRTVIIVIMVTTIIRGVFITVIRVIIRVIRVIRVIKELATQILL